MNCGSLITLCVIFTITRSQGMSVEQQGMYNILTEMRQQQQQRPRWVERLEPCSATCNGGYQRSVYECYMGDRRVGEQDCLTIPKPESELKSCGQKPCLSPRITESKTFKWELGDWSNCSSDCGPGWQRRTASCVQQLNEHNSITKEVDAKLCLAQEKPEEKLRQCSSGYTVPCPFFASPDVLCFEPPCKSSPKERDRQGNNGNGGGGSTINSTPSFLALLTIFTMYIT